MLLQEGGPLPGPESGLLSNTRKWIGNWDLKEEGHFKGKEIREAGHSKAIRFAGNRVQAGRGQVKLERAAAA